MGAPNETQIMQDLLSKINNNIYAQDTERSYSSDERGMPWDNFIIYDFNKLYYRIRFNTDDRNVCKEFLKNMDIHVPYNSTKVNNIISNIIKIYKDKNYCDSIKNIVIPESWSKFIKGSKREIYHMEFILNKKVRHVDLHNKLKIKDFTVKMSFRLFNTGNIVSIIPIIVLQLPLKGITSSNYYITLQEDNIEIYEMNYKKRYTEAELYTKVEKAIDNYYANQVVTLIKSQDVVKNDYMNSKNEEKEIYKELARMSAI